MAFLEVIIFEVSLRLPRPDWSLDLAYSTKVLLVYGPMSQQLKLNNVIFRKT